MTGVLIATHYNIGKAILETADMVIGPQEQAEAIGIYGDMDPCFFGEEILDRIENMMTGGCDEVLILLDLFGGTPCNETVKLLREHKLQVLTGLNLPMVLSVLLADRHVVTAAGLLEIGEKSGRKGIINVTGRIALMSGSDDCNGDPCRTHAGDR